MLFLVRGLKIVSSGTSSMISQNRWPEHREVTKYTAVGVQILGGTEVLRDEGLKCTYMVMLNYKM
jgi:hypothetical protein